jgi:hypothetical protein
MYLTSKDLLTEVWTVGYTRIPYTQQLSPSYPWLRVKLPSMAAPTDVASRRMPSVRDAKPSSKQESLLLSLERRVQLRAQAERNAALLHDPATSASSGEYAASVKDFLRQNMHHSTGIPPAHETPIESESMRAFAVQLDECVGQWKAVYDHAHKSFGLVEEMEQSHEHVVSKTQALYDSFENILQQVEALTSRVELIAAPMPHFMAIDGIARTLGFGVKFASPSAATSKGTTGENASGLIQQAVQVFQHKRNIDPTTPAFRDALEQIDVAVTYLESHVRFPSPEEGFPFVKLTVSFWLLERVQGRRVLYRGVSHTHGRRDPVSEGLRDQRPGRRQGRRAGSRRQVACGSWDCSSDIGH